jgi:hypothetical protein
LSCFFFFSSVSAATAAPPLSVTSVEPPPATQTAPQQPPCSRASSRPLAPHLYRPRSLRSHRLLHARPEHRHHRPHVARPLRSISVLTESTIVIAVSSRTFFSRCFSRYITGGAFSRLVVASGPPWPLGRGHRSASLGSEGCNEFARSVWCCWSIAVSPEHHRR